MSDLDFPKPEAADAPYPAVRLLRRHGNWVVLAFAAAPAIVGIWAAVMLGGWSWAAAGVAIGVAVGFVMRCFVELVRIIADMLLPR